MSLPKWKRREKNGLTEDPLVANGLSVGTGWLRWVRERGCW